MDSISSVTQIAKLPKMKLSHNITVTVSASIQNSNSNIIIFWLLNGVASSRETNGGGGVTKLATGVASLATGIDLTA